MKTPKRYLVPGDYMADPSVHVWDGKLYIYPSHDWESGIEENDNGDHFNMKDYHVFSLNGNDPMTSEVVDHGMVLEVADIPWAGRQLWDCEVARKDGKYYMYFPLKDRNDIFRLGVAISDKPEGPFIPQPDPVRGSYSIDFAVFEEDGEYYMYAINDWGEKIGSKESEQGQIFLKTGHLLRSTRSDIFSCFVIINIECISAAPSDATYLRLAFFIFDKPVGMFFCNS